MRFEMFKFEIQRADRVAKGFLIASDEHRASEIIVANEINLNQENRGFNLERVDETLPPNMRKGLDALLESAPTGLASYCEPIGWVAHALPAPKLHLWRIEEVEGDRHFVIAPTGDLAVEIYCECVQLEEGEASMFSVHDGLDGLKNEALRGLPALLKFGPIGMVAWNDERGWSHS